MEADSLFNNIKQASIFTFNTRSLRAYLKKNLTHLFDTIYDVAIITEVQSDFDSLARNTQLWKKLLGYKYCFWNPCVCPEKTSGYSGTAIWSRRQPSRVVFGFLQDLNTPLATNNDIEGRIITLFFKEIAVIGLYIPCIVTTPGSESSVSRRVAFDANLLHHCTMLRKHIPIILAGDFNTAPTDNDIAKPNFWNDSSGGPLERANFKKLCNAAHVTDSGSGFTWYPEPTTFNQKKQLGMRIDMILYPNEMKLIDQQLHSHMKGSDHRGILSVIGVSSPPWIMSPALLASATTALPMPRNYDNELEVKEEALLQDSIALLLEDSLELPPSGEEDEIKPSLVKPPSIDETYLFNLKSDPYTSIRSPDGTTTPRVPLFMNDTCNDVMVDTGSTYCLVAHTFAKRNVTNFKKLFKRHNVGSLTLGDGKKMTPIGTVFMILMFVSLLKTPVYVRQEFVVMEELPNEHMILGHAFFQDHQHNGADIKYQDKSLVYKEHSIPWCQSEVSYPTFNTLTFERRDETDVMVPVLMDTTAKTLLKPRTITRVTCKARSADPKSLHWGICTPSNFNESDHGGVALHERTFFTMPISGFVDLWVSNFTNETQCLPAYFPIAQFAKHDADMYTAITAQGVGYIPTESRQTAIMTHHQQLIDDIDQTMSTSHETNEIPSDLIPKKTKLAAATPTTTLQSKPVLPIVVPTQMDSPRNGQNGCQEWNIAQVDVITLPCSFDSKPLHQEVQTTSLETNSMTTPILKRRIQQVSEVVSLQSSSKKTRFDSNALAYISNSRLDISTPQPNLHGSAVNTIDNPAEIANTREIDTSSPISDLIHCEDSPHISNKTYDLSAGLTSVADDSQEIATPVSGVNANAIAASPVSDFRQTPSPVSTPISESVLCPKTTRRKSPISRSETMPPGRINSQDDSQVNSSRIFPEAQDDSQVDPSKSKLQHDSHVDSSRAFPKAQDDSQANPNPWNEPPDADPWANQPPSDAKEFVLTRRTVDKKFTLSCNGLEEDFEELSNKLEEAFDLLSAGLTSVAEGSQEIASPVKAQDDPQVNPSERPSDEKLYKTFTNMKIQHAPAVETKYSRRELDQFKKEFNNLLMSDATAIELLNVTTVQDLSTVPDYFVDGSLCDSKLPDCLKGLRVNLADITVSKEEFNLFIYECCVLPQNRDKFFSPDNVPGRAKDFEVTIDLVNDKPWQDHLRSLSPEDKMLFKEVLDRNLALDLIESSRSPNASRCILVLKDSGRHQIACCLNTVNSRCVKDSYPLPLIRDNLDCLGSSEFVSSIDICGAYLSMSIREADRDKLSFITHFGLYRWKVCPYGYKNASANFCFLMDKLLAGLKWQILSTYSDDCLVWGGQTFRQHLRCLNATFNRLQDGGLRISVAKCAFFRKEIIYLGFIVSRHGIKPCSKNIDKILKINITTPADMRSFLGMTQFYRRWVKDYSQLTKPLYDLLTQNKKLPRPLPQDILDILEKLKGIMSSDPVLRHPNFKRQFILETDGSKDGFGAMLIQLDDNKAPYVVAYASSGLPPALKKCASDKIECAAACWAMTYFRQYLGKKFILRTDNEILKWLRKNNSEGVLGRYLVECQEFDFDVEHVPGRIHYGPDLLSRAGARDCPVDTETMNRIQDTVYMILTAGSTPPPQTKCTSCGLMYLAKASTTEDTFTPSTPSPRYLHILKLEDMPILLDFDLWSKAQSEDVSISKIATLLRKASDPSDHLNVQTRRWYILRDDVVYFSPISERTNPEYQPRVYVPLTLRNHLLALHHSNFGHRGVKPIVKLLTKAVYWPSMRKYCADWIRSCLQCRMKQTSRPIRQGKTQHIIRSKPWSMLCIDFMHSPLPTSTEGYQHALIVIDVFTRYPIVCCLKTLDAWEIADSLMANVFSIFGLPHVVHSDNGDVLICQALDMVFARLGIKRTSITNRHPQGNAPAERFIRYLNKTLSISLPTYKDWPRILPIVLFAYRTMAHETTGHSPFFLNFGRDPVLPLDVALTPRPQQETNGKPTPQKFQSYIDEMTIRLQEAFTEVRILQLAAAKRNADRRDVDRFEVHFEIDDLVLYWDPKDCMATTSFPVRPFREDLEKDEDGEPVQPKKRKTGSVGPSAWRVCWTGPHKVVKKINDNVYVILHSRRGVFISVNVSDLVKYNPFQEHMPFQTDDYVKRPNLMDVQEISNNLLDPELSTTLPLKENDLIILVLPAQDYQPLVVARYIGPASKPNNIKVQWLGNLKYYKTVEQNLFKTAWYPGWFQPIGSLFYWKPKRQHISHPEFTEENTGHELCRTQVLMYGFELLKNHRLPKAVATEALYRWNLWIDSNS